MLDGISYPNGYAVCRNKIFKNFTGLEGARFTNKLCVEKEQ